MIILDYALIGIVIILILYLLAIMPKLRKPKVIDDLKNSHYAHRGLHNNSGDAPENSMRAFALAVNNGYGIEMDVQLTKDLVPVIFHDSTLLRMCGVNRKISDLTSIELSQYHLLDTQEQIPLLKDVLSLVNGKIPLIIEYKLETTNCEICNIVDQLLRNYNGIYCIESFNPLVVLWYRMHHPGIVRGQLSSNFRKENECGFYPFLFCIEHLLFNFLTKPHFISYNCLHRKNLARRINYTLFGSLAVAWTIKSREQLEENKKSFDLFIFEGFLA